MTPFKLIDKRYKVIINNKNFISLKLKNINRTISFSLLTFCFLSLLACSSSEDTGPLSNNPHLTVTIDGTEYTTSESASTAFPTQAGYFSIIGLGINGEDNFLTITIQGIYRKGTFLTSSENVSLGYAEGTSVWAAVGEDVGTGTVTITENNSDEIKGTFSFTGILPSDNSTREFSNGSFVAIKR